MEKAFEEVDDAEPFMDVQDECLVEEEPDDIEPPMDVQAEYLLEEEPAELSEYDKANRVRCIHEPAIVDELNPLVIQVGIGVGKLARDPSHENVMVILSDIAAVCSRLGLSLCFIIHQKLKLNALKYPPDLKITGYRLTEEEREVAADMAEEEKREIPKYKKDRAYAPKMLYSKNALPICQCPPLQCGSSCARPAIDGESGHCFRTWHWMIHEFAHNRNWLKRYTIEKITISLFTELGELTELFEWLHLSLKPELDESLLARIAAELADVAIYAVHMDRVIKETKAEFEDDDDHEAYQRYLNMRWLYGGPSY